VTAKNDENDDDDDEKPSRKGTPGTAQRIPQHKHCMVCNKAIPSKENLCSEDCENEYNRRTKKSRMYLYIMYGLFFVIIIAFVLSIR
jgi:predicted nucleic acid-binding Zn ribbon protein